MDNQDIIKLDNPVWHSLSETHKDLAIDHGHIKFYHPDYCPFGSFTNIENTSPYITEYSTLIEDFFIVGEKPQLPNFLKLKKELICLQMTLHNKIEMNITEEIIKLSDRYNDELFQLVNLVQPGYFRRKTFLMGDYYGIFKNGNLVSVTGERMKMDTYTEVSAVVTHPDYTRKGYAGQLIAHTTNKIFDQNKTPYLHVAESNSSAINLYKSLGFFMRRKISFWNIIK